MAIGHCIHYRFIYLFIYLPHTLISSSILVDVHIEALVITGAIMAEYRLAHSLTHTHQFALTKGIYADVLIDIVRIRPHSTKLILSLSLPLSCNQTKCDPSERRRERERDDEHTAYMQHECLAIGMCPRFSVYMLMPLLPS